MPTFGRTPDSVVVNPTVDRFTATASQTVFTLTNTPSSVVLVWVNGVLQEPTTHYTLSGRTLTLGTASTVGDKVAVEYGTDRSGLNRDRRWVPGSTEIVIDEFNDSSIAAAWARVDTSGHTGYVEWAEGGDTLSARTGLSTDATAELHAYMQPLSGVGGSLVAGDAIYACINIFAPAGNVMGGLILADGTTVGSGTQIIAQHFGGNSGLLQTESLNFTGYNTAGSAAGTIQTVAAGEFFVRLVMTAANTWRTDISPDGISWALGSATKSLTLTPTQVGIYVSSWASATKGVVAFGCIRRQAGII